MKYTRKTQDEYCVMGNYGHGFEEVTAESTRKEANCRLREYRENEPEYLFYVKKHRIPLTEQTPC